MEEVYPHMGVKLFFVAGNCLAGRKNKQNQEADHIPIANMARSKPIADRHSSTLFYPSFPHHCFV
jgi:hypothetical protein